MSTEPTSLMGHAGCVALAMALGALARDFAALEPRAMPTGGPRAEERRQLLRRLGGLAFVDGIVRRIAVLVNPFLTDHIRAVVQTRLERAGEFLGFRAEEWVASCLLTAMVSGIVGGTLSVAVGWGGRGALASSALGGILCVARLDAVERERQRLADRELPAAIDLIAMCMGAGMDFPGAVALVAEADTRSVVAKELRRLLRELSLGCTRREALLALGRRLPSSGVSDLVAAAVQAEQKGTPLSEVLANQAVVSRLRRSVSIEEAAARAGVLMIVPLMLLMGCVVLLLVGPLVVTGASR